jgi:hypothetical protein
MPRYDASPGPRLLGRPCVPALLGLLLAAWLCLPLPARGQGSALHGMGAKPMPLLELPTLINSNLVVMGHVNTCTTGPTATVGNAYACTLDRVLTTYVPKACYGFAADSANTGPPTLNLHGLGATPITKVQGGVATPLVANDIRAGAIVHVCYDGTTMQCQNCTGNAGSGGATDFAGLTGAASDAQIPNLNTLGTGLTASRCVETTAAGLLTVAATPCSTGGAGAPAGIPTQFQYNNAGVLDGTAGFVYADPTTLAAVAAGWKFGAAGVTANFTNPTVGNDINYRRAIDIFTTTDGAVTNTNFSTSAIMNLTRIADGPGQNSYDASAKSTWFMTKMTAHDRAQGQHFMTGTTMNAYAMGDAYLQSDTMYVWGGTNAGGDEGQGGYRVEINQQGPITSNTVTSVATTTCNTTLTQNVTKNVNVQTVTVASSAGCAIDDRVVIDAGNFIGSKPRMEIVKITAVGAGTLTAKFRESHVSGDTVQPPIRVSVGTTANLGAGRYLVNYSATPYTTGLVESISGTGFVGNGTTWANNMVGGTALVPGCIALDADDYSGAPFSGGGSALKGWFGIASVTDATHLNIAHFKEAAHPAGYQGNGVGTIKTYTIRPCARVLEVLSNGLYLEPNAFTWTVGQTVVLAHSVDLSVTALVRAQSFIYSPNVSLTTMYSATNFGAVPYESAYLAQNGGGIIGFNTVLSSSAHTAGAQIAMLGVSDTGLLLHARTYSGDSKNIYWTSSQEQVLFGTDYATGSVVMQIFSEAAALKVTADNALGYRPVHLQHVQLAKRTATGGNPGAAVGTLELVCGTTAGTAKLIAYAGTSTTPVTVADNIGSGVIGC